MTRFHASDGIELAYRIDDFTDPWRPADTIVLLHSAMSSAARYFAWIPPLSRRYCVARLDLRGHGESQVPPPESPLTVDRLVADVVEFLDEIGCETAHFVGASAGGYLCQRMAMDHPDRVASLCLFGSTPGFKRSQGPDWLPLIEARGLRGFLAETIDDRFPAGAVAPGLVEWFIDQAGGNDQDYILRFIELMTRQDWSDSLDRIRCPTFIAIPGLGKIGDNAAYEPMRERIADVTVKTYAGMPHNIWDICPERCAADVLDFLEPRFSGRPAIGMPRHWPAGDSFAASDGLTLRYDIDDCTDPWRTPDTLIVLHAAMGSARRLYAWVPELCREFRVVRLDLRGHGRSGVPGQGRLTLERLTLDVIELMDHLGLASAHLAGSSAGGIIAMFAAVAHPARVRSLAAFAAIPGLKMSAGHTDYGAWMTGIRDDGVRAMLKRGIADRFNRDEVDPQFVDWFLDEAARNDGDLLIRFVGLMSGVDFADRLGEIGCPTLLVVPGGDPNQSMEEYRLCRDAIRGSKMVVHDGKRHNITDAEPRRCAADLLAFLRQNAPV